MDEKNIKYQDCVRKNYILDISKNIDQCVKNKAMLSFKNEYLSFIINFVQISIIVISAGLTIMESIKSYYSIDSAGIDVISILFTALITLIMAIYRFFKLDDRKEKICNLIENYTFIINKFNRTLKKMKTFVIKHDNGNEWTTILSNYEDEILENYISIKETFDNIFTFKDNIYYKNKYKTLFLKQEFINNEIETIHFFKRSEPHTQYLIEKEEQCCNKKGKTIDYDSFIKSNESKYIEHHSKWKKDKKRNQDLYNKFVLGHDIPTCVYYDKHQNNPYSPRRDPTLEGNQPEGNQPEGNQPDGNQPDGNQNYIYSNDGLSENSDRPRMVIDT